MYQGDYLAASTVAFNFNTVGFSDGAPITLGGSGALSVYKNSTTESTAGITLTVDYDSRTGMHHVVIDTSADGTFYAAGNDFDVIITTGTVGGTSVVGRKVGSFSLENRCQKADVRKALGAALNSGAAAGYLPADTLKFAGGTVSCPGTAGVPSVDVLNWKSNTVPSPLQAGIPIVDLKYILSTAVTEGGAGRLAGSFTTLLNVASPVLTAASVNQTGDSYTRIGAAGAGLTALGDSRLGNLDAAVSTRSTLDAAGVWDLPISGHTTSGTTGAALASASSAGDPWSTALPGSYASGTAGNILGNNLTVPLSTVSTRVLLALPAVAPNANGGLPILSVSGTTLGYTVTTVTTTATATALSAAERNAIADAILTRNLAGGSSTGRTIRQALASLRNKVAFDTPSVGSFTVFAEDDSTPLFTGTYTASAAADPVVTLDPA